MTKNYHQIYDDGSYLENNQTWHEEDSPYKAGFVEKCIGRNNVSFDTCADIGCGAGLVAEILARQNPDRQFHGYDMSHHLPQFWQEREALKNLSFHNRDIVKSDTRYDLALCLDVFEHIEDYFGFLRAIQPKAEQFIFNIPLDLSVMKLMTRGLRYAREEVGHLHYFNTYTALRTLEDCGYVIEDHHLTAAYLNIPPRNIRQAMVLPLRLAFTLFGKGFAARMFGGLSLVVLARPA